MMKTKNVLVLSPVEARHKEMFESAASGCSFTYSTPSEVTGEQIESANAIIGMPKPDMLKASANLEWLQIESAGTDAYIKPGVLSPNTVLTNATGAYSKAVAEHAFALTLMLMKKLHLYRDDQRQAVWSDRGTVSSLADSTVAVIGLGDIGQHYAGLVKAMGAKVIGVKRRGGNPPACVDELVMTEDLDSVLPRADVIMSVLPNTAATRYIYTDERFDLMKDTAVFINCGRGNAVASDVLLRALSGHKIAAAAIDVTDPEPLPQDSPLWTLPDLVITPHISGGYHLPETFERIMAIAADNLAAYASGGELRNVVDFATGYKK
ncbi:MAG: D-2-hydroxyacid dehydrogenase [Lachnospiraceae bacterium]|nr:D-2-hydroxyacid dehydrogenase [Lachnospiraceae bacterium]